MSATRPRRLGLLACLLGLALVLPSSVAAGAGWRSLEGRLVAAHSDGFGGASSPRSAWYDTLVTSSGAVTLSFRGARPEGFYNGARVRVRGTMAGRTLTVGAGKGDASVQAPAAAAAAGEKRLAVLLVKFDADAPEPYTAAQAEGVVFSNSNSVANYFAEESYGLMTVTGDVFGYYTISINTSVCDYADIGAKARAAATAAGVDLGSYSQIQYVLNHLPSCGWAGLAYLPGRDSWLNQALTLRVSAHELSHSYGVHHAATWSCTEGGARVAIAANTANCAMNEYGDPFSVMGSAATRHTHNQQLASLGWITGDSLQTITSDGTYTIGAAASVDATSPRGVRIARGNGTWFYMELRQPFGTYFDNFNATDPVVNGVSIRVANDWTTIVQSKLIDTTPATSTYTDAALAVGASFHDPLSGVSVTTVSVADGVATVNVSWGADVIAPSTPGNPQVTATGASTARFSWAASSDNVGVTGYRVSRDGVVLGTVIGTYYDDAGLVPLTTYQYGVVALDAAGNASGDATRSFTMPEVDTTAPTPPTNLRATTLTKSKVTLAWNASSDDVGVAGYSVYRNGSLVATVTGTTWTQGRQKSQTSYHVVAFDAAGNASGPSNTLVVPKR